MNSNKISHLKIILSCYLFVCLLWLPQDLVAQFAFTIGDDNVRSRTDIVVDSKGNSYVIGSFIKTIDVDPTENQFELSTSARIDSKPFLASYTPEGQLRFAYKIGGEQFEISALYIAIDSEDNIYITGHYFGKQDFDPSEETADLVSDNVTGGNGYIVSYNKEGAYRFAINVGSAATFADNDYYLKIQIDNDDNLFLTGTLTSRATDFDPSEAVNEVEIQSISSFLASYTNEGVYRFAFGLPNTINAFYALSLATDNAGNIYIGGDFSGTVDFDPSENVHTLTAENGTDIFIARYDNEGNFEKVFKIDRTNNLVESGFTLTINSENNIFITGFLSGEVDFDPSEETYNLTTIGGINFDMFFASYTPEGELRFAHSFAKEETIFDTSKVALATDIISDDNGNVYLGGTFNGAIDFDNDGNEDLSVNIRSNDVFLLSYDDNGNLNFARSFGRRTASDALANIFIDLEGNLFLSGLVAGSMLLSQNPEDIRNIEGRAVNFVIAKLLVGENPVSLNDALDNFKIKLYPNPALEYIVLEIQSAFEETNELQLELVNLMGQSIYQETLPNYGNASKRINLNEIPKGTYLLRLVSEKGKAISKKLVIQ